MLAPIAISCPVECPPDRPHTRAAASVRPEPVRRLARLLFAAALSFVWIFAPRTAEAGGWVIPPGEEAIATRLLGGELPAGCALLGASLARTRVEARYSCGGVEGELALVHPSEAPLATVRSAELALVVPSDSPLPRALVATIGARLRTEGGAWRWLAEGRSVGGSLERAGISPRARRLVGPLAGAAGLGFVAALALALARRSSRDADRRTPPLRRVDFALAALTAAVVLALLASALPRAPVHADTTRDLLMAAECVAGQPCDHGPPTTLGVLVQGALWTRALAACRTVGLGPRGVETLVLLAMSLAGAVVFLSTRRRFGRERAFAAAVLYVVAAAFLVELPLLWNPSLAPLPLAAFHALLVAVACDLDDRPSSSLARAAGAAFALALAIDCHIVFAALVPVLLAAVAGCARRPVPALLAAVGVLVATLLADSRTAWLVNGRALVEAGAAAPLVLALVATALAGALARRRLRALSATARAASFVGVATVYVGGASAALFVLLGPAAGVRYLVPATPGLALGAAWLVGAIAARAGRAARLVEAAGVVAIALSLRAVRPFDATGWTYADVEAVAPAVFARAPTDRAMQARVRAAAGVVPALSAFAPRGAGSDADPGDDLLVRLAPKSLAPPPAPTVTLVDLGSRVAVVAAVPPFLDRTRTTFCFAPRAGAADEAGCAEAREAEYGVETAETRAYPAFASVRDAFPDELLRGFGDLRATIALAVHASPGPNHVVALLDEASGWRIEKVVGVRARGALPAVRVVLEAGTGDGEIVLARDESAGAPEPDRYRLPAVAEVPEDAPALVRLLDDRSAR